MNRRGFLKAAVAIPAGASLPVKAAAFMEQSEPIYYAIMHPDSEEIMWRVWNDVSMLNDGWVGVVNG